VASCHSLVSRVVRRHSSRNILSAVALCKSACAELHWMFDA
jgi:hypothetical protein